MCGCNGTVVGSISTLKTDLFKIFMYLLWFQQKPWLKIATTKHTTLRKFCGNRGTECLNTSFLLPILLYAGYRVKTKKKHLFHTGLSTIVTHNDTARLAGDANRSSGGVLFAAGGCAAAALALLAGAAAAGTLYKRGNKARHHDSIQYAAFTYILFIIIAGQSWRGSTKCYCKYDWLWVQSSLEEMKCLFKCIFSFICSGVEEKRGGDFCHSLCQCLQNSAIWEMVYLNILLCVGYSVELI